MSTSRVSPDLRLSISIPALDEAANLPHVLPRIPRLQEIVEVILVDGGSTDNTIEVARECLPNIRIVRQGGKGKSDAVRCGVQAARGEFVLTMDADGSHDPSDIPRFLACARAGYDLVKGARYLPGGGSFDDTRLRRTLVWITDHVANTLWGTHFTDIVFGMFLIRQRCFFDLGLTSNGFAIESQIVARVARRGYKICEIPVIERPRLSGSSHLSIIRDGWFIGSTVFVEFGHRILEAVLPHRRGRSSTGPRSEGSISIGSSTGVGTAPLDEEPRARTMTGSASRMK
jgi:glycosyltransferase involved in cell wall biosynthesis